MSRAKKGTPEGDAAIKKMKATMIARYGSEEAVREFYKNIGRKGGKVEHPETRPFRASTVLARIAGSHGGRVSRRGPSKKAD